MLIQILNRKPGSDVWRWFENKKRETTDCNRFNLFSTKNTIQIHAKPFHWNVSILIKYLKAIKCHSAARVTHTNVQFFSYCCLYLKMINMFIEMPTKVGNQKSTVFLVYFADGCENKDSKSFQWQKKDVLCMCTYCWWRQKETKWDFISFIFAPYSFFLSSIQRFY